MVYAISFGLIALSAILIVWAWVDVFTSKDMTLERKGIWYLLFFLLPVIGPIIYFQVKGRDNRRKFGQRFGGPNASFIR